MEGGREREREGRREGEREIEREGGRERGNGRRERDKVCKDSVLESVTIIMIISVMIAFLPCEKASLLNYNNSIVNVAGCHCPPPLSCLLDIAL